MNPYLQGDKGKKKKKKKNSVYYYVYSAKSYTHIDVYSLEKDATAGSLLPTTTTKWISS